MEDMRYHVTLRANLDSIMRDGLVPMLGSRSVACAENTPAVYLFRTLNDVMDAAWLADEFEDDDLVVLAVAGIPWEHDFFEIAVPTVIPPSQISVTNIQF